MTKATTALRARTIIIWWQRLQYDTWGLHHDGGRRQGDGPWQFTSVNYIFNLSLHLEQQQDEGQFWDKEDFQAAMARLSPPSLEVKVPHVWDGHSMLAQDSSCRPRAVSLGTDDSTHSQAENKFYDYLE
jgi:hypothetical protein